MIHLQKYVVPHWIHCHYHRRKQAEPLIEVFEIPVVCWRFRNGLELEPCHVEDDCLLSPEVTVHQNLFGALGRSPAPFSSVFPAHAAAPSSSHR